MFWGLAALSLLCAAPAANAEDIPVSIIAGVEAWSAKKYDQAYKIFLENAEKGSPPAMTALGYMYAQGVGVKKDLAEGLKWYRQAAAAGEVYGMYYLSALLRSDPKLEGREGEGMALLEEAVKKDLPEACREYHKILQDSGRLTEAQAFLRKCSEGGQTWAMTALGVALSYGEGVVKNEAEGLDLLKKAAAKGDVSASHHAAVIEKKRGHDAEARKLHEEAASLGYAPSLYMMGRYFLEDGRGEEALKALQKASQGGYAPAQLYLGRLCERGKQMKADLAEAARYYKMAADSGDPAGCNELGRLTEKGLGVPKSPEKAFALYEQGAQDGNVQALYNRGRLKFIGLGTKKDQKGGIADLQKAADLGESEAITALAAMHYNGDYLSQDREEGLRLYRAAATLGNPKAQYALAEILRAD